MKSSSYVESKNSATFYEAQGNDKHKKNSIIVTDANFGVVFSFNIDGCDLENLILSKNVLDKLIHNKQENVRIGEGFKIESKGSKKNTEEYSLIIESKKGKLSFCVVKGIFL